MLWVRVNQFRYKTGVYHCMCVYEQIKKLVKHLPENPVYWEHGPSPWLRPCFRSLQGHLIFGRNLSAFSVLIIRSVCAIWLAHAKSANAPILYRQYIGLYRRTSMDLCLVSRVCYRVIYESIALTSALHYVVYFHVHVISFGR